jgi:dephospho-CoA kinase
MQIIGITGTNGAGKTTIVEILKESFPYTHLSVRKYLVKELKLQKREVNRDNMRILANELRSKYGPGYIVQELYKEALELNQSCFIESIRCVGEIETLRDIANETKSNFLLIGIDAEQRVRYERTLDRSQIDQISFQKFKRQEEAESRSEDPGEQNLIKCLQMADKIFYNNNTIKELKEEIKDYMQENNNELKQLS